MSADTGSLARRYARAMIELGREEDDIDLYGEELLRITKLMDENPQLYDILINASFPKNERLKTMDLILEKMNIDSMVKNFCSLLLQKERMDIFFDIAREYSEMRDVINGVQKVSLTSAEKLAEGTVDRIEKLLSKAIQKKVVTSLAVDPELIGGLVLQMENKVYDGSIRLGLKKIREMMTKES